MSNKNGLILGIDGLNLQNGGGLTHIRELLSHAAPNGFGFERVVFWGGGGVMDLLPVETWLEPVPVCEGAVNWPALAAWYRGGIQAAFRANRCDIVLSPGGLLTSKSLRYVSMSQNMLLYERKERQRFPLGINRLRYKVLAAIQKQSFKNASGVIFISHYARRLITEAMPFLSQKKNSVVYHGVNQRFLTTSTSPKRNASGAFNLLYVSRVNYYKHQWKVVQAVNRINADGLKVRLTLIGDALRKPLEKTQRAIDISSPGSVSYVGEVPYEDLHKNYATADAFLFASTCENMPNILLEAMAAGLPVISSHYGPMPEILGDDASYFDPTDVDSIVNCINILVSGNVDLAELSRRSVAKAQTFTWNKCADQTFRFLQSCMSDDEPVN